MLITIINHIFEKDISAVLNYESFDHSVAASTACFINSSWRTFHWETFNKHAPDDTEIFYGSPDPEPVEFFGTFKDVEACCDDASNDCDVLEVIIQSSVTSKAHLK
jgi:hypothetical protein